MLMPQNVKSTQGSTHEPSLVPVVTMGRVTPAAGTDLSSWHGLQGPEQHNSFSGCSVLQYGFQI